MEPFAAVKQGRWTSQIVAHMREVRVHEGDVVRGSQLLARLDGSDAQAALRRARAEHAATAGPPGTGQQGWQ